MASGSLCLTDVSRVGLFYHSERRLRDIDNRRWRFNWFIFHRCQVINHENCSKDNKAMEIEGQAYRRDRLLVFFLLSCAINQLRGGKMRSVKDCCCT